MIRDVRDQSGALFRNWLRNFLEIWLEIDIKQVQVQHTLKIKQKNVFIKLRFPKKKINFFLKIKK